MSLRQRIKRFVPITAWLGDCSPQTIKADVLAGLALAGLLVPQGMAYAGIAGVPPQMGLYAALGGMLAYALFGTSRQLAVACTSSSAAMLGALIAPMAGADPAQAMLLASAATLMAGLGFLAGGVFKLGSISEFISTPVLKGFVFGLALTIIVKQGHNLTGMSSGHGNFFHQVWHAVTSAREINLWTVTVGVCTLAVMMLLSSVVPRVPSGLVVLVLGTVASSFLGLKAHGVQVVGTIEAGMPSLSWPRIGEDGFADLFIGAIGIVLVIVAETLVAASAFASKHNYDIDPNQELLAMGAANITSGLLGGIIVGGGMSGTAANDSSGARTQLSSITAAVGVALTLAFLLPLIQNLPEAVLAAIVIYAVAHLADVRTLRYYAKLGTGSLWMSLIALVAVLQMGILKGLIFAVCLTLVAVMHKLSAPRDSVLGRLGDSGVFQDIAQHPEARQITGLLIYRPNGMLFFANATRTRNAVRDLVRAADKPLRAVLLNMEASPELDVTSLAMLEQLCKDLQSSAIELDFARVSDPVSKLFERSGFLQRLGENRVFPGVDVAVDAIVDRLRIRSSTMARP